MKKETLVKFNTITNILLFVVLISGGMVWADTNGVWIDAKDVRSGTFGSDEGGGEYVFEDSVKANGDLCVDGECHSSWDSVCQSWLESNSVD